MNNEKKKPTFFTPNEEELERIEQEVVPSGVDNHHPENYYG